MLLHIRDTISDQRKKILPSAIALALIAGVMVSILASSNAQADYANGCGYGYSSTGTFGYGGLNTGYGYGAHGSFGYGYGSMVCSLLVTSTTLAGGTAGTPLPATGNELTGSGGLAPYTWSATVPDGLGISGQYVVGTPAFAGNFIFTVTMTDANGQSTTGSVTIPIASSSGGGGGGGTTTTTTTAPTTTTTAPTTTTTAAPTTTTTAPAPGKSHRFFCHGAHGFGFPGRTLIMNIFGSGFYAQPKITSNEFGTRFGVLHDRGNVLVTHVTVRGGSRLGWHTLTVRLANGRSCKANYVVKR